MSTHINLVEKVKKAAEVISHIKSVYKDRTLEDVESLVWEKLATLGIEKDNEASHSLIADGFCKEGDARAVFCEGEPPTIPVPWFRKIWAILSDGKPTSTEISGTFTGKEDLKEIAQIMVGQRPASQWNDKDIIEAYNIDCSSEVLEEFKKRADGKTVVAFEDRNSGKVNVEITLAMLRTSRRRTVIPIVYSHLSQAYRLFTVGDFPSEIYEESPLSPGTLLFKDYCEDCYMDFSGVSKEARQFLRIAYNEGVTPKKSDRMAILGLISAAKTGIQELKRLFPEIGIIYDELESTDNLPSLKNNNATNRESVKSDPFGNKRF